MIEYRPLRIALLGAGTVGGQVARLLLENKAELAARVGAELELIGIAVRDINSKRAEGVPAELLTTDAEALILSADIVIEVMGGIEPARTLIRQALLAGADVITANKALLANHSTELFDVAEQVGAQLYYEAAVAAGVEGGAHEQQRRDRQRHTPSSAGTDRFGHRDRLGRSGIRR